METTEQLLKIKNSIRKKGFKADFKGLFEEIEEIIFLRKYLNFSYLEMFVNKVKNFEKYKSYTKKKFPSSHLLNEPKVFGFMKSFWNTIIIINKKIYDQIYDIDLW